jgi:hypothetical protein
MNRDSLRSRPRLESVGTPKVQSRPGENLRARDENQKAGTEPGPFDFNPGDDRLSHAVTRAVPWALEGLTTVFEMGTGVAPPVRSPETC